LNVTFDSTTSPSVSQLYGTLFALSGVQPSGATPTPTAVPDDVHASVRTEQQDALQDLANLAATSITASGNSAESAVLAMASDSDAADDADAAALASSDPAIQQVAEDANALAGRAGDEADTLGTAWANQTASDDPTQGCFGALWSCPRDPGSDTVRLVFKTVMDQLKSFA